MPVGRSSAALWETEIPPVATEVPPPRAERTPAGSIVVDKPWAEVMVGAFAVLLAASVFLPWYHNALATVSGWSSGTWGPIIFFLALGALGIVTLRRLQISIAFPVESPLVVEAIGWACVIGLILKRYFQPVAFGAKLPSDGWIFASLACALGMALLAGVASSSTSFVLRPRWFEGKPGWIGAGVLVVALAAGVSLGFTNTSVPTAAPLRPGPQPTQVRGVPACAKRDNVPTPSAFTPYVGYDSTTCIAAWSTTLSVTQAYARYIAALRAAGWTVTDGQPSAAGRSAGLKGKACGTASVAKAAIGGKMEVVVEVVLFKCSAQPTK
jgi:hypothetical protein